MEDLYNKIKQANAEIKTTNIKGKEYAEVNERVKAFRKVYPDGFILTDILHNQNGRCVIEATVGYTILYGGYGNKMILAKGMAYEDEGSNMVNTTSYIENAETSAVGRALGFAGFGIDAAVASAEEVSNAIKKQTERKATQKQVDAIKKIYGDKLDRVLKSYNVGKIEEITIEQASKLIQGK